MKEIQLISTDFSPKILKQDKLFYLGPWCNNKTKKENNTLKYVWANKKILKKDYKYLKILLKKLNKILPKYLNNYHKKKLPSIFWQSLLWVWLSFYLSATFFKFTRVKWAVHSLSSFINK